MTTIDYSFDDAGVQYGTATVSWGAVDLAEDDTNIGIMAYEVHVGLGSAVSMALATSVPGDTLTAKLPAYRTGQTVYWSVRAVGNNGIGSDLSDPIAIVLVKDSTPPPVPAGVTAVRNARTVVFSWDGTFVGGAAKPADFSRINIYRSPTTPFTPSAASLVGRLYERGTVLIGTNEPNVPIYFAAQSVDVAGNASASATFTTAIDNTPPVQPSTPTLTSKLGVVIVDWNGKDNAGAAQVSDFSVVQIHAGTSTGFTPSDATQVGTLTGPGRFLIGKNTIGATVWVKLVAVDTLGNASTPSASVSIVVAGVTGPDIVANSLTANEIQAGTMSALIAEGDVIRSPVTPGVGHWEGDSDGLRLYNPAGEQTVGLDTATGDATVTGKFSTGFDTTFPRTDISPANILANTGDSADYAAPALLFHAWEDVTPGGLTMAYQGDAYTGRTRDAVVSLQLSPGSAYDWYGPVTSDTDRYRSGMTLSDGFGFQVNTDGYSVETTAGTTHAITASLSMAERLDLMMNDTEDALTSFPHFRQGGVGFLTMVPLFGFKGNAPAANPGVNIGSGAMVNANTTANYLGGSPVDYAKLRTQGSVLRLPPNGLAAQLVVSDYKQTGFSTFTGSRSVLKQSPVLLTFGQEMFNGSTVLSTNALPSLSAGRAGVALRAHDGGVTIDAITGSTAVTASDDITLTATDDVVITAGDDLTVNATDALILSAGSTGITANKAIKQTGTVTSGKNYDEWNTETVGTTSAFGTTYTGGYDWILSHDRQLDVRMRFTMAPSMTSYAGVLIVLPAHLRMTTPSDYFVSVDMLVGSGTTYLKMPAIYRPNTGSLELLGTALGTPTAGGKSIFCNFQMHMNK